MSFRMAMSDQALRELAEAHGVCVRPIVHEVYDSATGRTELVPTPCGATREAKCGPCAAKNRALRMQQCREGWHLDAEPEPHDSPDPDDDAEEDGDEASDGERSRRCRSTRRRQDTPDLPRLPVEDRTLGRCFTAPSGRCYRPSMFATFTLPSYGRVRPDGTPVDPETYDYRRAALDALHFPKLIDRLWQNLRRTVGFKVQYFAAVEPQRRLAPHLHAAIRGAIARESFRQVVAATYHQVWWPAHDQPVYEHTIPVWTTEAGYLDPDTGQALPTWQQALDALDDDQDARPAHVLRFGSQLDLQGIIASEGDADRRIGYLTKYLTKSFSEAYASESGATARQRRHLDRLHAWVRILPCSPRCQNWLAYGVQPDQAVAGMVAGACPGKAHDREHLGCGGRRVLVSRRWTGKRLSDHKADRSEVVRQVLVEAGFAGPEVDRLATSVQRADGAQRFHWRIWDPLDSTVPVYGQVMTRAISEKLRWRAQYDHARHTTGRDPPDHASASSPDNQPTGGRGRGSPG